MTRRLIISSVMVGILFLGVATASALTLRGSRSTSTESKSLANITPGLHSYTIQGDDGLKRKYILYIPKSYNKKKSSSLVVAFHGGGGTAKIMASESYGIVQKAEKEGYIAAFPNGASQFPTGILATWNAGNCCEYAVESKSDDIGFTRKVVEDIQKKVNIDKNKIFATGMSNGGMLSYRIACELSDIFSAVSPVSGTEIIDSCNPSRPISVFHIHAINDENVPFNGGYGSGVVTDIYKTPVPDTIKRWVERNKCNPTPTRVLNNEDVYCDLYTGCSENVQVKLCVTSTGGHSWPGAIKIGRDGADEPADAISANDEMWTFFQGLKLRKPISTPVPSTGSGKIIRKILNSRR